MIELVWVTFLLGMALGAVGMFVALAFCAAWRDEQRERYWRSQGLLRPITDLPPEPPRMLRIVKKEEVA